MTSIPSLTLNSGAQIPQLGLGVFQVDPADTERVVSEALELGYRHIDTAAGYQNEEGVGRAIAASGIPRSELFVTTKLRTADQPAERVRPAIEASLGKLGLDYLDLYLIHWPAPELGNYVGAWLQFEQFAAEGLTRSIGVSNFLPEHLDAVIAAGSTVPAVDQIELHPRLQQREAEEYARQLGVLVEAWSPIARGALVDDPKIVAAAERHGKTVAQLTLRWHLEHGRIIIPRTVRRERMQENAELFDFELTPEEVAAFDALEADGRIGPHPALNNRV